MEKTFDFCGIVFTPAAVNKLIVNGESRHIKQKQQDLLRHFLRYNHKYSTRDEILAAVWPEAERSYGTLSSAMTRLNKDLSPQVKIKMKKGKGYKLSVDLTVTKYQYEKLETILVKSPLVKKTIIATVVGFVFFSVATFAAAMVNVHHWLNPPTAYMLENFNTLFARNYLVGTSQLSPDGRYLAHRLSRQVYKDDYLAIFDLQKHAESKLLVRMGFEDGFEWNLTGDKIVYQRRLNGACQIRLLTFNADKTIADDKQLTECAVSSGQLSFAWFNDHQFYVNLVAGDTIDSDNGLPQHHLYSFDINSLRTSKIKTANLQGGVGFYSLEYDPSTDSLYLLKTSDFISTGFYRYHNGRLSKLASIDYLVKYYTVADDRLIYKNNRNQFLINQPAADFSAPKMLLASSASTLSKPHLVGNQLAFLVGDTYRISLYQWADGQLSDVNLEGFKPGVLARYKANLVFSSDQSGIYQLYMHASDHRPRQISNMKINEYIQHIDAVGELFVLSYRSRVELYRYADSQLQLLKTLTGYSKGLLNADATRLLLTEAKAATTARVIEMQLADFKPTGLVIEDAKLALYHHNDAVYLNQDKELIRLVAKQQQIIASNIEISSVAQTAAQGDKFYYVVKQAQQNTIAAIDLSTGLTTAEVIEIVNPAKIEVIDNKLFIRAWQTLRPKLMIGIITEH